MLKPVVNKRNHFDAAAEHVDRAMDSLPNEYKHPNFRKWCQSYTERVVREVAMSFATAAASGIQQAANLICNPDFYETRKRTNERQTKKWKEEHARQQWEHVQRRECPTAEQIAQEVKNLNGRITYCQGEIAEATKRLGELQAIVPSKPLMEPKSVQ